MGGDAVSVLVGHPVELRHVRVARSHELILDVIPALVQGIAISSLVSNAVLDHEITNLFIF